MSISKTQLAVVKWLANGNRGLSSEAMAYYLGFGIKKKEDGACHPRDPGDFNRCLELLRAAPSLRKKLPEMSKLSKQWKRLAMAWDVIEASLEAEVGPDWSKHRGRSAQQTFELMEQVLCGKPHRKSNEARL